MTKHRAEELADYLLKEADGWRDKHPGEAFAPIWVLPWETAAELLRTIPEKDEEIERLKEANSDLARAAIAPDDWKPATLPLPEDAVEYRRYYTNEGYQHFSPKEIGEFRHLAVVEAVRDGKLLYRTEPKTVTLYWWEEAGTLMFSTAPRSMWGGLLGKRGTMTIRDPRQESADE